MTPSWFFAVAAITGLLGALALPIAQALLALDATGQVYGTLVMTIALGTPPMFALGGLVTLFRGPPRE